MKRPDSEETLWSALRSRARTSPAAPLLTFYDLATGERMELSAASLDNAVAKTAGLLRDELDIAPGDTIVIRLPLHWQRAVWQGASSAVGARLDPNADPSEAKVLVTDRDSLDARGSARDTVVVSLEPFGLPSRDPLPADVIDHAVAARGHPDVFTPWAPPIPDGTSATAESVRARRGFGPSARILVTDSDPDADDLMLAVPLAIAGTAVLVRHAASGDVEAVATAERVTAR